MTEDAETQPDLKLVRGTADAEELAALIAVVSEAYAREVAEARSEEEPISAWNRTRRPLRTPLRRDIPWGRFSG